MNKVTITDIARKCGVSIKTVSRVINQSPDVSDATRKKVLATMKEEGYQVNLLARGLKGSRTNIIIVFTDRHQEEHLSIWHNIMLKHLFYYAKENSLKIVMSPSNSERYLEDETDGFYLLASGIADGAILLENVNNDARVEYLEKEKIPYVVLGEPEDPNIHSVSLDNYDVGYKGASYLADKGYRNIAFLLGEEKFLASQLRMKGFEEAVAGRGIKYRIDTGVDTIEKAYQKALQILSVERVNAFFVSGDERAIGVYRAVHENKLHIPDDIAILGIDNIPLGQYYYPPISSVRQDFKQLAYECIHKLVLLINQQVTDDMPRKVLIPASIIEREST
ncbi:MAG: LacI family transcriptional regulator [Clostridiales bacterium]|nr:LacI family transcriptional regulator [Clostridiales bacterium]